MSYANTPNIVGLSGQFDENGVCEHNVIKVLKIPITPADCETTGAEIEVHEPLPRALVLYSFIEVVTPEATGSTKTIDFGTKNTTDGGDVDGFIDGASVAAAGVVKGTGALVGTVCPKDDHIVIGIPNGFSELVANLYLVYIEV